MRIVRPVVQTVTDVTGRVRDLNRLQEVARVLAGHGLGMLVAGLDLPGTRNLGRTFASTPDRLKRAIEELGPTYVKLGQVLSTRPDLLPPAYIEALQELQDDVDPLPWESVQKKLNQNLGDGWVQRFSWFNDVPLATASIAQVHRGRLNDGTEVVLKVQRPGIGPKIRSDLNILQFLARRALVEYPETRAFDPVGVVAEFEHSILSELDFELEARNMERVRRNFEGTDFVKVPDVYPDLSNKTVLCMEFLAGIKMRDARESGCDMSVVGQRYLTAAYDMLFQHGLFHGDLHPGNVIVLPGEVLGLLDFGMVGRLTPEMRNNVISILFALQRGDYRTIARLFYDIAIKEDRVDFRAVEGATIEIMERHWTGHSVRDMQLGPFVVDLAAAAAKHGARVPRAYTMFFKAILTSEGLAKKPSAKNASNRTPSTTSSPCPPSADACQRSPARFSTTSSASRFASMSATPTATKCSVATRAWSIAWWWRPSPSRHLPAAPPWWWAAPCPWFSWCSPCCSTSPAGHCSL